MAQLIGRFRKRRLIAVFACIATLVGIIISNPSSYEEFFDQTANAENSSVTLPDQSTQNNNQNTPDTSNSNESNTNFNQSSGVKAVDILEQLEIKGRAPKTGYNRGKFYSGWPTVDGCNLRQRILKRELGDTATLASDNCTVISGEFTEPYTGSHLIFREKSDLSTGLQIDHVVALSDAWQKGAQYMDEDTRYAMATDPLNLLAVDSKANQGKSDGDAATWLPPNKSFRCQYVARQVSVKYRYHLWVTQAEHDAIANILATCPNEPAIGVE